MTYIERAILDDKIDITGKKLSKDDIEYFITNECPYTCGYEETYPPECCCNEGSLTCKECWNRKTNEV